MLSSACAAVLLNGHLCWYYTTSGFFLNGGRLHFNGDTYCLHHPHPPSHTHTCIFMHRDTCTQKNKYICQVVFAHFDILRFSRRLISPSSFRRVTWAFGFSDAFQRILNSMFCMIHMGFYVRVCIRWHFFSCEISSEFVQKCVCLGKFAMLIFTILTLFQLVKLGKNTRHMFLNLVGVFH